MLRIDSVELDVVLGLRLNVWTSIVLFAVATAYFVWAGRRGLGRETEVYRRPDGEPTGEDAAETPGAG